MAAEPARAVAQNSPEAEAAYDAAPDALKAELVHGMVCMAPAAIPRHQRLVQRAGARLLRSYDRSDGDGTGPGGWVFLPEPELHLGERPDKLKPDLAGWRETRAHFSMRTAAISAAPDFVCEVLSPSTEAFDRGTKAAVYAGHGVEWLWLVDPEGDTLEVFRNERGVFRPVRTLQAQEGGGAAPFEAASLDRFFEE